MKLLMDCNPCTKISTTLSNNQFISHQLFRWLKLNELFVAMVMGNVKDEKCFSNLRLKKNNFKNILTTHLDLVVKMFTQKFFTFDTFPFATTMNVWNVGKSCHIATKA
jgi:hypothetical protein